MKKIINKKLCYIISFVLFITLSYIVVGLLQFKKSVIKTNATPSTQKVIVLDAGHGKPDERSCLLTLKITLIFYKK